MTRVRQMSIAHGHQGTLETLRLMVGLTNDAVAEPAFYRSIDAWFPADAKQIDTMIRRHYSYAEEEVETLYAPLFNFQRILQGTDITGDCDDVAMFLAAVLKVKGYAVRFVAMRTKRSDPDFYHVVVEALEHGRWKRFDPTVLPGLVQVDYGQMVEYV